MKQVFFLLLMLVTTSTLLFSQSADEKAVRQTAKEFLAALKNNDADSAGLFLTGDYGLVGPGVMMNKVQRLAAMKSGQLKYESFNYENVKVVLYGTTAVAKTTVKVKVKEQDVNLVTLTLVKNGEQWKVAGECLGNSCDR